MAGSSDQVSSTNAWVTNALLALLLLVITAQGAIGRDAYNTLQASTAALTLQGARIEAQLAAVDRWTTDHEGRQHSQTNADYKAIEARVAVLEMAVQTLRREQKRRD